MHRDKFTEKLRRILNLVDAGALPISIREVYIFGSYARGALTPGDLDLVIVHETITDGHIENQIRHFEELGYSDLEAGWKALGKFKAQLRGILRKRGERVQILLETDLRHAVGHGSRIQESDLVLLWSETERKWHTKIDRIAADPTAGRAPRNHIVALTRLRDTVGTMERVVQMISENKLALMRISATDVDCELDDDHAHRLAHWMNCRVVGKQSMKLLPYAM